MKYKLYLTDGIANIESMVSRHAFFYLLLVLVANVFFEGFDILFALCICIFLMIFLYCSEIYCCLSSGQKKYIFIFIVLSAFILLSYNLLLNHEIWRDEAQSYLIIRDSASLLDLFLNTYLEGHPILWHAIFMPLVHYFKSIYFFQLFHLCIGILIAYIILKQSPFSCFYNILIIYGYFFIYEYNIFTRSYSLGVLLIFYLTAKYNKKKENYKIISLLLFFLANINVMCLIFVIGSVVTEIFLYAKQKSIKNHCAVIITSGVAGSIVSFLQISRAGVSQHIHFECLYDTYNAILKSFFPLPNIETSFWQSCFVLENTWSTYVFLLFFLFLMILFLLRVTPNIELLCFFVVTMFGYIIFFNFVYSSSIYHSGFMFITFIVTEWRLRNSINIQCFNQKLQSFLNKTFNFLFLSVLYIHVISGAIAYTIDYAYSFSGSFSVSKYLKNSEFKNKTICAFPDYLALGVLTYNNIDKFYSPQTSEFLSFIKWSDNRNKIKKLEEAYSYVKNYSIAKKEDVIFLTSSKLFAKHKEKLLFETSDQIRKDEKIFVYLVKCN